MIFSIDFHYRNYYIYLFDKTSRYFDKIFIHYVAFVEHDRQID